MKLMEYVGATALENPFIVTTDSNNLDMRNARITEVSLNRGYIMVHFRGLGKYGKWRAKPVFDMKDPNKNRFILTLLVDEKDLPALANKMTYRYKCAADVKPYDREKAKFTGNIVSIENAN